MKLQKGYHTDQNVLIAPDFWQARYGILLIILLKEFIKLNVNTETMIKTYKNCRVKYKYCNSFVEHKNIKDNLTEYKCLCCNKNYQQKFDEKLASQSITIFTRTKLVTNLHYKTEYLIHMRNLNQASNHQLVLQILHRIIKFKQRDRLK